jgi:hypothetical protein
MARPAGHPGIDPGKIPCATFGELSLHTLRRTKGLAFRLAGEQILHDFTDVSAYGEMALARVHVQPASS